MDPDQSYQKENDGVRISIVPVYYPDHHTITEEDQHIIDDRLLQQILSSSNLPENLTFRNIFFTPGRLLIRPFNQETFVWLKEAVGKTKLTSNPLKILTNTESETCYSAFYYAMRSGNVRLLDTLINKWPNNYFRLNLKELDEILSQTYAELKIKNVPLSEEIEIYVETELINHRFYANQAKNQKCSLEKIKGRIDLVIQNISLLKTEYLSTEKVNEKFLFIAKFIAQNIHILKRQLKSTYNTVPWEEMEFCLISFVSACTKRQEINLFYNVFLNKCKILNHLENFAKKLGDCKEIIGNEKINKLSDLPKLQRDKVVARIIGNSPEFEVLYSDHQEIRDIHSLEKISEYIKLGLSADPKQKEGQIILTRVLQVVGEFLKNTLEAPKLSSTASELFLLSLPKNTRMVIIKLRNSLSHAYSLSKRTEIEENANANFFIGVQNDTKVIDSVITEILYNKKFKMIRILLNKITNSSSEHEIKGIAEILNNVELDEMMTCEVMDHEKLETRIKELRNFIVDKTSQQEELFNKIDNIIKLDKSKKSNIRNDYATAFELLRNLGIALKDEHIDHNAIRGLKFIANKVIENMPAQIESRSLKVIIEAVTEIFQDVASKRPTEDEISNEINKLVFEITYLSELEAGDLKCIEELKDKLYVSIPMYKKGKAHLVTKDEYNKQLTRKSSELKSILRSNALNDKLTEIHSYKENKKLQAIVEMLVLDIISILGISEKHLVDNRIFLDDNSPLLTGKCLRNHLAHDNSLLDLMISDPSIAIILNAKKLSSENLINNKKKIGQSVRDDLPKLKSKFEQYLLTITNKEKMFLALEEGNLKDLKSYLKQGADINARSIDLSTTLHYAARGPSLELVKFIIDKKLNATLKNSNGQSPLHLAAAHGRHDIVNFFIKQKGVNVDDLDNSGKTALHLAAKYGHKDVADILLNNKANNNIKDKTGFSPLHYSINNNYIDVVQVLLNKEDNVDINETMGGFTSLHLAAERGHLDLVTLLVEKGANVNARNDRESMPIHSAALNGHKEIVNALILHGADVNSRVLDGCSALHYAVENGHEEIASILLKYGANVNVVDKTYYKAPLHYASKDGYEQIVKTLLVNKAIADAATVEGITPLRFAAGSGHLTIVALLLRHGVNVNAKDIEGATPLHHAAERGHQAVAELLIQNCANVNDRDSNNRTPLHIAALNGHRDIVELLLVNKSGISAQDIEGSTPLHAAAAQGSIDVIDLLLKTNANVNGKSFQGLTPLHVAAINGHLDAIDFLLRSKADVNAANKYGITPLFEAIAGGQKASVNILIENGAKINIQSIKGSTPLLAAVSSGHKEIVEILIAKGTDVNFMKDDFSALLLAIKRNYSEIVEILLKKGANVERGDPLFLSVLTGRKDIVELMLKYKAFVNKKGPDNSTVLHSAAKDGHKEIVNTLIAKGATVDAQTVTGATPLYFAAQEGHGEVCEILIKNKADVNFAHVEGSALHIAAAFGRANVVEVLLNNGAKVNAKDHKNRTALELAVARKHFQVVKLFLQLKTVDINARGNDGWTILHIASQENNLEMVKYLVDKGYDINAKNSSGSKPIHIAAREGFKDTVEFFLSKGLSIDDFGAAHQTLLHYAAMGGHLEVVKFLIEKGADVNAKDGNGSCPIHMSALFGHKVVIEFLLSNGAIYNAVDKIGRVPLEIAKDVDVIILLDSTDKLFDAVKLNSSSEVAKYTRAGAFVNSKNLSSGGTALHYAAWKGYEDVMKTLLQNKADPNVVGSKGFTPLHYAAKFSHLKIVRHLLRHGAIYNAISDSGKTPSDFTADTNINGLFKLISESFRKVSENNAQVIYDLNKIKDIDTVRAVMGARNKKKESLVIAALHSNFSDVEKLKDVSQSDVSAQTNTGIMFLNQGDYQRAFGFFKSAYEQRREVLGPNNPGTLDIQTYMAKAMYKQGIYQEALNMFKDILNKQKEELGLNDAETLSTRSLIALVLHRQGHNEDAFYIYQEVYPKQREILGENNSETLNTQFHMALVMNSLGKYEEALIINKAVYKKRKETLGPHNTATVSAKNNIAMVLSNLGEFEESLKMYKDVFEMKKLILGINNADTLRTLRSIGEVLANQMKYPDALKTLNEVLNIQKKSLTEYHPETLKTKYSIANALFDQGKGISALKLYTETYEPMKAIFGPNHSMILDILKKMEIINLQFKVVGVDGSEYLRYLHISTAASEGDVKTVKRLLKDGADANDKDNEGRTPLHFAVGNGHIEVVRILLTNGADVQLVTNKGNTTLHTATSKSNKEIVEILCQHISRDKLSDFVNAKTIATGTTALHVAAKAGSLEVVASLLKYGATYNIQNKEGKIPANLSTDQKVSNLLNSIEQFFNDGKTGNVECINKLKTVKPDELISITNARNNEGKTLLQVAIAHGQKKMARKLLELLKK